MLPAKSQRSAFTLIELLIVVIIVVILAVMSVPHHHPDVTRAKVSRVRNDQRLMAVALEAYRADHKLYPDMRPIEEFTDDPVALVQAGAGGWHTVEPGDPAKGIAGLTTPTAYLTMLFPDPFSPEGKLPIGYYTEGDGWILLSPGPDRDYDIKPASHFRWDEWQGDRRKVPEPILLNTYDPTNGTVSNGDLWRTRD